MTSVTEYWSMKKRAEDFVDSKLMASQPEAHFGFLDCFLC